MNWGIALALFVIALALLVIGWRGTYAKAWQVITGQSTTFGQGAGTQVADPAAQGAQGAQQANQAAGAGAAALAQEVTDVVNAILKQQGLPQPAAAPASSGNLAGTIGGFQP